MTLPTDPRDDQARIPQQPAPTQPQPAEAATTPARRASRRWPWIAAAALVVLVALPPAGTVRGMTRTHRLLLPALLLTAALVGCGGDPDTEQAATAATSAAPAARAVSGSLMLDGADSFDWDATTGCRGSGGYDDITPGAQVVITDSAGATVGLGKLGNGVMETAPGAFTADGCKFNFTVKDVPTGKNFYGVEVSHRGKVQYPEQQVFGALALTLGS